MTSRKGSIIAVTQETSTQTPCRILTYCAPDSLVSHFHKLVNEKDLMIQEVLSSLKLPEWLEPKDLNIFCLKTYPDSYRMTKAGRFVPSSVRLMSWGIMLNGKCLTARTLESHKPENECTLSAILTPAVPEKYYLSPEQTERFLDSLLKDAKENESTQPME